MKNKNRNRNLNRNEERTVSHSHASHIADGIYIKQSFFVNCQDISK